MGNIKKIYEIDQFKKCPNCGEKIYRGRINDQCVMLFYYKTEFDLEENNQVRHLLSEAVVRIGNPVSDQFNYASICRSCLLLFFKATQYHPLSKGMDKQFNLNLKELQKKAKTLTREPLKFSDCPVCGNKLDSGYLSDHPPAGFMPGVVFHMRLYKPSDKRKEEPIMIAEDFYQNFFEAYFCHSCFTAIGRIEKFRPLYDDYWDRFERPAKKTVVALQERLKRLEEELNRIDSLYCNTSSRGRKDVKEQFEDRLPYEYLASIASFLEPAARYQFCPHCGVENNSENRSCRRCGFSFLTV